MNTKLQEDNSKIRQLDTPLLKEKINAQKRLALLRDFFYCVSPRNVRETMSSANRAIFSGEKLTKEEVGSLLFVQNTITNLLEDLEKTIH